MMGAADPKGGAAGSVGETINKRLERLRTNLKKKLPELKRNLALASEQIKDISKSNSVDEAIAKTRAATKQLPLGVYAKHLGRALVCSYFIVLAMENMALFRYHSEQWEAQAKHYVNYPEYAKQHAKNKPRYPYINFLLVPCAVAGIFNFKVAITAGILTLDMLKDSAELIWRGTIALIMNGMRPNELMVKKLGMFGCVFLVLVGAIKDEHKSSVAGMLLEAEQKTVSKRKSAVLLAGRLLMAALFIYMTRIYHRSEMWTHQYDKTDGHDNNWLILELVLSLPFAVGYKTRAVTLLLALTLWLEAFTCWPYWRFAADAHKSSWALGKFVHARSHFSTNVSVAGGLLLLAGIGAGRFTVDNMMAKKNL